MIYSLKYKNKACDVNNVGGCKSNQHSTQWICSFYLVFALLYSCLDCDFLISLVKSFGSKVNVCTLCTAGNPSTFHLIAHVYEMSMWFFAQGCVASAVRILYHTAALTQGPQCLALSSSRFASGALCNGRPAISQSQIARASRKNGLPQH